MKSSDMFRQVINDFQYKPNFGIGLYEVEGQWRIRIVMFVEDAREPMQQWQLKPAQEETVWFGDSWYDRRPSKYVGYSPSRGVIEVQGTFVIPPFGPENDNEFLSWLVYQVKGVEEHEMDEWMRYKGKLIRDPHAPIVP